MAGVRGGGGQFGDLGWDCNLEMGVIILFGEGGAKLPYFTYEEGGLLPPHPPCVRMIANWRLVLGLAARPCSAAGTSLVSLAAGF